MQADNLTGRAAISYPIDFGKSLNVAAFDFGHKEWPHENWIVPAEHEELTALFKGWGKPAQGLLKVPHPCPYTPPLPRLLFHPSSSTSPPSRPGASSTAPLPHSSTKAASP